MNYKKNTTDTNQYFPTPDTLIKKMLEPYLDEETYKANLKKDPTSEYAGDYDCYSALYSKNILEPSAGEGAIIKYINKSIVYNRWIQFSCCEIDPQHRETLSDYNNTRHGRTEIVGHDFLEYKKDVIFDYILMNPPFNTGAKHFLHAFNISQGAEIVCLLNAETLKNAYSVDRKLILKIIEDNQGTVEYIQNSFTDADRQSDVEIALIRVKDKSFNPFDFNINFNTTGEKQDSINFKDPNEIMTSNIFKNNEIAFENAKEALKELLAARRKLSYYTEQLFSAATSAHSHLLDNDKSDILYGTDKILESATKRNYHNDYNEVYSDTVKEMRVQAWKRITDIPKISNLLSETSREHLKKTVSEQSLLPYTEQNMMNIYLAILLKIPDIRKQTIYDSFDWLTSYHKDNRIFPMGWKTNDSWKVNNKCILARGYGWGSGRDYDTVTFDNYKRFEDLEKACEYLSGEKCPSWKSITRFNRYIILSHHEKKNGAKCEYSETRTPIEELEEDGKDWLLSGEKLDSRYFTIKFYKAGSIHLEFKSKELHDLFNYIACKDKKWLPPAEEKEYKTKYKDSKIPTWIKEDMGIVALEEKQEETAKPLQITDNSLVKEPIKKIFENHNTLFEN